jgi:hypothetical protein
MEHMLFEKHLEPPLPIEAGAGAFDIAHRVDFVLPDADGRPDPGMS